MEDIGSEPQRCECCGRYFGSEVWKTKGLAELNDVYGNQILD